MKRLRPHAIPSMVPVGFARQIILLRRGELLAAGSDGCVPILLHTEFPCDGSRIVGELGDLALAGDARGFQNDLAAASPGSDQIRIGSSGRIVSTERVVRR